MCFHHLKLEGKTHIQLIDFQILKSNQIDSNNIKQQHMADMLNIDVKTYRQIETCHKIANFETIQRLIRFLNDKEDMMMN